MTQNQINYQRLLEDSRSHRAQESENSRHNRASEGIDMYSADTQRQRANEDARHNIATEQETKRSNVANEGIKWFNAEESQRHNLTAENETRRSNLASESEQVRYHDQIAASNEADRQNRLLTSNNIAASIYGFAKELPNVGSTISGLFTGINSTIPGARESSPSYQEYFGSRNSIFGTGYNKNQYNQILNSGNIKTGVNSKKTGSIIK